MMDETKPLMDTLAYMCLYKDMEKDLGDKSELAIDLFEVYRSHNIPVRTAMDMVSETLGVLIRYGMTDE